MAAKELHEPEHKLSSEALDRHRARVSLNEELEAVDWYDQRVEATSDDELKAILQHNRDEENEHAALLLRWLRKRDRSLDEHLDAPGKDHDNDHENAHEKGHGAKRGRAAAETGTHLRREQAPFAAAVWKTLDQEAARVLGTYLAARKVLDVQGPLGWERSAVNLGRSVPRPAGPALANGLELELRQVLPLIELRVPFSIARAELEAMERGAEDPDLRPLVQACRALARAEDRVIFHGHADAGVTGIIDSSVHEPVSLHGDFTAYPDAVVRAIERLRAVGIAGPYSVALGPRWYDGLAKTAGLGGYPILEHVRRLVDGKVVWAPALEGAVVLSQRGGDHRLVIGQDATIGYRSHDAKEVVLYVEESMTFRLLAPEAAVALKNPG
jgi:uncharacterized linocin/CFP29 family protein